MEINENIGEKVARYMICLVFLLEILFSIFTLKYNSLLLAIGFHAAWDFCYDALNFLFMEKEEIIWYICLPNEYECNG